MKTPQINSFSKIKNIKSLTVVALSLLMIQMIGLFMIGCIAILAITSVTICVLLLGVLGIWLFVVNLSNSSGAILIILSMIFFSIGMTYPLFCILTDFFKSFRIFCQEGFRWLIKKVKETFK